MSIIKSLFVHLWCMFFDGFPSSHVGMWDADHKESWAPKNWFFQTGVLEKTVESPFDCKEIKLVNPKGNQPWIFTGRTDGWNWSSHTSATWCEEPTHWKRTWCYERLKARGENTKEHEVVGWHHQLNGHEFEQSLGDSEGQRILSCYSPRDCKELDLT